MNADFAETVETPATALVVFQPTTLAAFNNGILDAVEKVAAEARARVAGADVSTEAGREVIRSTAYKVARSKTALDDLGAQLVAEQKRTAKAVDESRREMRGKLDDVKDEIRKPLTEFENAEARRVDEHESEILKIRDLLHFDFGEPVASSAIEARLAALAGRSPREWQEFQARADAEVECVKIRLDDMLAKALKRQAAAAELARLQREQAEREQRERDERIAAEAAAKAKREAESAAELLRVQAMNRAAEEQSRRDAEAAAEQRRRDEAAAAEIRRAQEAARLERLDAERRHREEIAARQAAEDRARKAEQAAADAIKAEQHRVACAKLAEEEAARAREADKKHRAKINGDARDALTKLFLQLQVGGAPLAIDVVTAIARGEIPHVTISY